MDAASGGGGVSVPSHDEPVPECTTMDVILTTDGVQMVQTVVDSVVQVPGCHNCTVLRKELEDCKRDRAFFVDIKRKMILTDTLIQKHQSKCQAFEEQQKSIQNLTTRLAQSKRDCKVLEEQLASTLKDIIPWKKDKERFLQESQESKKQFEDLHNKLKAHESLIRQYESKIEMYDEEKAVLESDILVLKSSLESAKQSSRKASTSLEKAKEDNIKLRKEMSQVRKSKAALNMKFERAKTKVRSLYDLLLRHGIKAPRMKGYSSTSDKDEEEAYMEESDSSEQEEGENSKDTMVTKKMDPRSLAKPVTMPTYHHQSGIQPPHSAPLSRRPFPKMDFTSVACLSPLPPSPLDNRVERDDSSDGNESDTTLTEAAAKIEAQLSTPVLFRRQREQANKEQSTAPTTRVSPRRKAVGRTEARSSGVTDDPESADGAMSRRGIRPLRKGSDSSLGSRTLPTRISFRASKRLELGNSAVGISEKKKQRGRPRKVKDASEEKHSSTEKDHCEDLSKRLQGRVQTLSSSDDEAERKDDVGGKRRKEQNGVPTVRTRSKTKEHVGSGQSLSSPEKSKVLPMGRDLALSSDEESKHSLYNPADSPASEGSETGSIIGRKKRLNLKRQTLRKSSALSDSSESEDDHKQGTDLTRGNNVLSIDKRLQSRKSEGVDGKRSSDESIKSNKLASDSEADPTALTRRSSRRLAHRQNDIKRQASLEEETFVKECSKAVEDPTGRNASKTEDSSSVDEIQSEVATTDRERISDNGEQSIDNSEKLPPGKRVTRQLSKKLLRSLSSPPVTRKSKIRSQEERSNGDGLSQFQRKPGRGLVKDKKPISKISAKEDNSSPNSIRVDGGEDISSQERTLLRNLSSPARLTRSASRNLALSEPLLPSAEKHSSEQKNLSLLDLSLGEQSKPTESQPRRLSQKRSRSDSQSSEEEKAVKSLKSTNTGSVETRTEETEHFFKEGDEDSSVRNEKVLMRSETEEFVACMDDMPCIEAEESMEHKEQTSLTAGSSKTIPGAAKDTKKRKTSTRNSKRIKISAVDTIEEKGESSSCFEGVAVDAGGDAPVVDVSRESRNILPLDRPSTSRGLESSGQVANEEAVRIQPPILFPEQRERHPSSASLPSSERDSPVSPIQEPFQGFTFTRPISPMSPERPVERVSPILPAFFFDLPNIPRMLSPLPPSPPRVPSDEEDAVDAREEDIEEMMSEEIPEAQAQPRMISPLFPTPVPFAVSPIPEMSVPPAISPIDDIQHPPEVSPIVDVQPPVLGVQAIQTIQTISPGKSPQLPSPRIFHSVAPSDAITVRPQHSSPSYNQDKTTAIRSLNAVLDRDDNTGDHRSSFSKKLIARRSSAEEPGRKPGDVHVSQNNPLSHSERTGARAITSINLAPIPAQRSSLDHETIKQPHISTQEQNANQHLIKGTEDTDLRQIDTNSVGEQQGKKDAVQPPVQNKMQSGFNEYLRRADGHEEATAFSRVIPHRDESRTSSVHPNKTELSGNTTEAPSCEKAALMPNSEVNKREELTKRNKMSDARKAVVPDKPKQPTKSTVGNIWGQIAFEQRAERIKHIAKKKQTKRPSVDTWESDSNANPQFKVPSEPPITASHVVAQQSVQIQVQTQGKDQVPRTKVFPGFVPASRTKAPKSPQPVDAHPDPALNASQSRPGPNHEIQDLEKPTEHVDQGELSDSSAIQDQAGTGAQDDDPSKTQTKTTFIRPNKTNRLSDPITPDQIKAIKKLHLHDVLRLIRDHSPKESVFPIGKCVIEFLEENSVNLFPAIYAKCIVGNTSMQPVISPHEEQISKIIIAWTKQKNRKNVMHYLLTELSQRLVGQGNTDLNQTVTFSRLFAAICRETDWMVRVRLLCYDIIREGLPNGYHLLLAMAAVWPSILRKKDGGVQPMLSTMELVVMHQLQTDMEDTDSFKRESAMKISKCLAHLCNWQPCASESMGDSHAQWLIALLKDPNIATFQGDKRQLTLGNKCFETIKAVELLASSQGWEWTNNKLIIEQLWPVLKDWSKSLSKSTAEKKDDGTPGPGNLAGGSCTSLASACAVMKVIGNIGQIGLVINVQSVEQLMKMLIAVLQQPSQSIPWPMQLYTAQSIYDLSPSNQDVAGPVLRQWVSKAVNAVPEKLAEQINYLGRKLQSPEDPNQFGINEDEASKESK